MLMIDGIRPFSLLREAKVAYDTWPNNMKYIKLMGFLKQQSEALEKSELSQGKR